MFGDHLNIPELQWPWHDRFQILKEMRQRRQRMITAALCYIFIIHHLVAVIASAAPHLLLAGAPRGEEQRSSCADIFIVHLFELWCQDSINHPRPGLAYVKQLRV